MLPWQKDCLKSTRRGWICERYNTLECGSGGCRRVVYSYEYPKDIDKMIAENPEFKKEIFDVLDPEEPNKLSIDCYGGMFLCRIDLLFITKHRL